MDGWIDAITIATSPLSRPLTHPCLPLFTGRLEQVALAGQREQGGGGAQVRQVGRQPG